MVVPVPHDSMPPFKLPQKIMVIQYSSGISTAIFQPWVVLTSDEAKACSNSNLATKEHAKKSRAASQQLILLLSGAYLSC